MVHQRHNSNINKNHHCRRNDILKQLLLLVKEIEKYDQQPQHYFHDEAIGEKHEYDHCAVTHDPSQRWVSEDLRKDEYYRPVTVDGKPARPVLTRKAIDQSRVKWCPPCFDIVPAMDYTISCYQPPHEKNMQEMEPCSIHGHPVEDASWTHGTERRLHHLPDNIAGKQINQHYQHYEYGEVMARDGKHHTFGNQVYRCKCVPCQPQDQIKHHIEGERHNREHPQEFHHDNKCFYDLDEDSSKRVRCHEDEHMGRRRQPYSGRPGPHHDHHWEGGDGKDMHYCSKETDTERYRPHEPRNIMSEQHRPEGIWSLKLKEHSKEHHGHHEPHMWDEPKHHQEPYPKAVVMLKHNDDFRHNEDNLHSRVGESKYYPVLVPKDMVWPKQSHKHGRYDDSKYQPVLIPKEVIHKKPLEFPKRHDEHQPHWGKTHHEHHTDVHLANQPSSGKIHHGSPLGHLQYQPSSGNIHHGSPLEHSMDNVDHQPSWGKIHHGSPEHCTKEMSLGQYHNSDVPMNQRRNGLVPQVHDEKKSFGQSVICYDDRVRKEQREAMNWDPYGGQNCSNVRPPKAYFTYPCPKNDMNHNHWSPPETTICRYPNTCMASCFEHPATNNWVYQQPAYRCYIQNRDYTPF